MQLLICLVEHVFPCRCSRENMLFDPLVNSVASYTRQNNFAKRTLILLLFIAILFLCDSHHYGNYTPVNPWA